MAHHDIHFKESGSLLLCKKIQALQKCFWTALHLKLRESHKGCLFGREWTYHYLDDQWSFLSRALKGHSADSSKSNSSGLNFFFGFQNRTEGKETVKDLGKSGDKTLRWRTNNLKIKYTAESIYWHTNVNPFLLAQTFKHSVFS